MVLGRLLRVGEAKTLKRLRTIANHINDVESDYVGMTDDELRGREPELWAGLSRIRDRLRADPVARKTIEQQFALKNTMGYGLNSFLDHDRPVDVLARLIVGSEGTLAFITSITMRTVPVLAHTRTGLLVFDDLAAANRALPSLVDSGPATIELLDRR